MQGVLKSYQNKIEDARANIYLQEQRLQEAYEETGYTEGIDNVKKNTYGDLTGAEVISQVKTALNMPNATDEEIGIIIKEMEDFNTLYQSEGVLGPQFLSATGDGSGKYDKVNQQLKTVQSAIGSGTLIDIFKDLTPSLDKVNDYLEKNSKILVAGTTSTNFPGETDAMAQTNTKAIKSTFEKRPLNPNFRIFYGGLKQDGTGSVASLIEDYDLPANTQLKVTQVTFDKQPYLGEPTVSMQLDAVDPKTGENIIVKVPTSNFQASGMDQYFNDPMYKIAMTYGRASVAGLDKANVGFYNSNGQYAGHLQYNFNEGGDVVSVGLYDINKGLINTMTPNDPELEQIIRLSDERGQSFRLMTN
jgi:hypothetical protein